MDSAPGPADSVKTRTPAKNSSPLDGLKQIALIAAVVLTVVIAVFLYFDAGTTTSDATDVFEDEQSRQRQR